MTKGNQGRFLLLYGSQTGQAKAIAEEIFERAPDYGLDPEMHCFSMTNKKFSIEKEDCAVIVVSTTGEGDPPDTATKFWRRIKKKTLASDYLAQLRFTLLGLGDSNYTNFCRNGKNFDHRLQELGASHFYPPGFADDATGLEIVAEPWLEGLYPALRTHLGLADVPGGQPKPSAGSERLISEVGPSGGEGSATPDPVPSAPRDGQADPSSGITETDSAAPVRDPGRPASAGSSQEKPISSKPGEAASETSQAASGTAPDKSPSGQLEDPSTEVCSASTPEESREKLQRPEFPTSQNPGEGSTKTSGWDTPVASGSHPQEPSPNGTKESTTDAQAHAQAQAPNTKESSAGGQRQPGPVGGAEEQAGAPEDGGAHQLVSDGIAALQRSVPPLAESGLTLPVAPPEYLEVEFHPDQTVSTDDLPIQGGAPMPSAASPVTMATVVSAARLTRDDAVKTALDVELDISECGMDYQPGDSFSVICPNDGDSVHWLLGRLGLQERADCPMSLALLAGTKKRRASLPDHIPAPLCTPRHALLTCCEIHSPLKKGFLRALVEHTTAAGEKRRLQELCSKQGAADYGALVREPGLSLLDVLAAFPSCLPPLARVLEHLPRLQPRPYSIASSPLANRTRLHFVFNVVVFPEGRGRRRQRRGVCTGWLSSLTAGGQDTAGSLAGHMAGLSVQPAPKVPVFGRANQHFRLPADPAAPIVMVGPGTGVAPFVGFLQHRQRLQEAGARLGPAWLFFGCRHKDRDYLYRETLEGHLQAGVLSKLSVSFSRDQLSPPGGAPGAGSGTAAPRYVQDNMRLHAADLCRWILEDHATVFVCGDAKNMAKNVNAALSDILGQERGKSPYEAACLLATLREEKRYLEDVWT